MKIFDAATWPTSLIRTFLVLLCGAVFSAVYFAITLHRADSGLQRVELNVSHGLVNKTTPLLNNWNPPRPECGGVHKDPGNIAIIVKTGATVISERLPTLLLTSLRCVDDPMIFSDLEQEFGGHHVHDVLSNFSRKDGNPDFDLYRTQQEYATNGRQADLPNLRELPMVSDDWRTKGKSAAWSLDKYKFLHMIDKAWELRRDQDWYLFLEADTFISWTNLLRWLPLLDPSRKLYFGSAVRMYESPYLLYFANGGSGMPLSGAAVSEFAGQGVAQKWDSRISKMWFGDYVLAAALHEELGLQVTDAKPTMIHDEPSLIAFNSDMWCKPVVALHHLTSEEQDRLWELEQARNTSALLFRDVYNIAYPRGLPSVEAQWDNLAQERRYAVDTITDTPKNGSLTVADTDAHHKACQRACQRNEKCLQYVVHTQLKPLKDKDGHNIEWSCYLSRSFTLGRSRPAEPGPDGVGSVKSWMSGWMSERIAEWVEQHQECVAEELVWPGR